MAYIVNRPRLTFAERIYLPTILSGLMITLKHILTGLFGKTRVTMQYPEQKWDAQLPEWYRGAPTLVTDEWGRDRCVACQLCEFICPPRAITIKPMEIPAEDKWNKVEKRPEVFDIDMIRCIYCGLCEEACPTGALILGNDYKLSSYDRESQIYTKDMLTEKKPGEAGRDPKREI